MERWRTLTPGVRAPLPGSAGQDVGGTEDVDIRHPPAPGQQCPVQSGGPPHHLHLQDEVPRQEVEEDQEDSEEGLVPGCQSSHPDFQPTFHRGERPTRTKLRLALIN